MGNCSAVTTIGAMHLNALEIQATGIPPADGRESAVLITLVPANYTAILRGVNDTTGIALAEVYRLD